MAKPIVATYFAPGEFPDGTGTELEEVPSIKVTPELRGPGSATLEQMLTASVKPAAGGVIAFDVRGRDGTLTRCFAARCKKATYATMRQNVAEQRVSWELPGHLQVLSKGLITPPNGIGAYPRVESVTFNWSHPEFNDGSWTAAHKVSTVAGAQAGGANEWAAGIAVDGYEWSAEWTEPNSLAADIIGPNDGTNTNVSSPNGADQNHYFRQTITVSVPGPHKMAVGVDNYGEFYIDGVLIGTWDDWRKLQVLDVDLSVGDHVVGVYLQNVPIPSINPCGYAWALYRPAYPSVFVAGSRASQTVHVEYQADPPGMTWGEAWRHALQPHIDAGRSWALAIINDFDDADDSYGNPWPITPNLTARVGQDSLLSFWQKGQESYMDGFMDENGWTLHSYCFSTYGVDPGLVLGTGNATTLTHVTEEPVADELLVDSQFGVWDSVGDGETQGYVAMGTEVALGDIDSRGEQIIDIYGDVREEITATYEPEDDETTIPADSEIPFWNPGYRPGSRILTLRLSGAGTSERVLSVTLAYSESAPKLQVGATLKDRIQETHERLITELTSL